MAPLLSRSIAKIASMRCTVSLGSGVLRRSASSKNLRGLWLQQAASDFRRRSEKLAPDQFAPGLEDLKQAVAGCGSRSTKD